MQKVFIIGAKRTPIGKFNGRLRQFTAVQLATIAAKATIASSKINPDSIDQVIFGNAIQGGNGQNVARQIELNSGIPNSSTAFTVNQVCGSGLKSIHLANNAIKMQEANVILAGGTESMSNVPYLDFERRRPKKFGSYEIVDGLEKDGLLDAFSNKPMGITAENVAERFGITRSQMDSFAYRSHKKAIQAVKKGTFSKEIVPIKIRNKGKSIIMDQDEGIRFDTSLEKIANLKPAFKNKGKVTPGNAASLNDGASAVLLASAEAIKEHSLTPKAEIFGYSEAGVDPQIMGYAPYYAIKKLLTKLKLKIEDIDLFEINEAFASQVIAVTKDLNIPLEKVNISGGAIALGHPLGDSGARIVATLINNLKLTHKKVGIASLCMGGGIGAAVAIKLV